MMLNISVILPTYNPQEYLYACLDSLKKQTYSSKLFEIIIILNGCKEPYYSDIQKYIQAEMPAMNITFIQTDIVGVSNARNIGLQTAKGEYICFVDDDDIVSSNYLEALLEVSTPCIIGVSNIHSFKDDINNWSNNFFACKVVQKQANPSSLFKNRAILSFPVAKLIHRSIIEDRIFDVRFKNGEDVLFMSQISDKISRFAFTGTSACYFVRERDGSATKCYINRRELVRNVLLLTWEFVKIYCSSFGQYNLLFMASRIPGIIKGNFMLYKNKR